MFDKMLSRNTLKGSLQIVAMEAACSAAQKALFDIQNMAIPFVRNDEGVISFTGEQVAGKAEEMREAIAKESNIYLVCIP